MASLTSEELMLKEPKDELLESVQEEFSSISEPQENVRVAVTSDMNLDGEFEDAYLLATDRGGCLGQAFPYFI